MSRRIYFFVFLIYFCTQPFISLAKYINYDFPIPEKLDGFQCAFDKTLVVGNSLSGGLIDSLLPEDYLQLPANMTYGDSPGQILTYHYADNEDPDYLVSQVGTSMKSGNEFIFDILLNKPELQKYQTYIGLDMFYLSHIFNDCKYVYHLNHSKPALTMGELIKEFINFAAKNKKNLILGTIPEDDLTQFGWLDHLFLLSGQVDIPCFGSPNPETCKNEARQKMVQCRNEINNAIYSNCSEANRCYISDLRQIISDLKTTPVKLSDGVLYDMDDVRPTVNINEAGTQLLVEDILGTFSETKYAPYCPWGPEGQAQKKHRKACRKKMIQCLADKQADPGFKQEDLYKVRAYCGRKNAECYQSFNIPN